MSTFALFSSVQTFTGFCPWPWLRSITFRLLFYHSIGHICCFKHHWSKDSQILLGILSLTPALTCHFLFTSSLLTPFLITQSTRFVNHPAQGTLAQSSKMPQFFTFSCYSSSSQSLVNWNSSLCCPHVTLPLQVTAYRFYSSRKSRHTNQFAPTIKWSNTCFSAFPSATPRQQNAKY